MRVYLPMSMSLVLFPSMSYWFYRTSKDAKRFDRIRARDGLAEARANVKSLRYWSIYSGLIAVLVLVLLIVNIAVQPEPEE